MKRDKTRKKISLLSVIAALVISIFLPLFISSNQAGAVDGSQFKAGRIMDDVVFYDKSTMSISQIQNFLNSKVPVCETNHAYSGSENDSGAPYKCLKDYRQNTTNIAPESGLCSGYTGASNETAAQIIYKVAHSCGINPQVILVMLQKEQGLITDTWPWDIQYRKAMGAFCPDTAPCNPAYSGFFYQVYYGAHRFKVYAANPNSYNYKAGRNNYILYNPNAACGGSNVYIENQATASLYIYTPYQPNPATLAVSLGVEAHCGAYGNKNFWWYFTSWFGTTYAPSYAWSVTSQQVFADSSRTKPVSWGVLSPGSTYYASIATRNAGNQTWTRNGSNPVLMGTKNNVNSPLCNSSWLSCNRAALLKESSVGPTETGTFEFSFKAPSGKKSFKQYFNLLSEGKTWMNDIGMHISAATKAPTPYWSYAGQDFFSDSERTIKVNSKAIKPNTTYYLRLRARNTGNTDWTNSGLNPIRLGTSNGKDRNSRFCDNSWISCNRAATIVEESVSPGEIGTFEFSVKSPNSYGSFNEYFQPVVEGKSWLKDVGLYWQLHVKKPTYQWKHSGQSAFTDNTKSEEINTNSIAGGTRIYMQLRARNEGNATWQNSGSSPTRLGTVSPTDRSSKFCEDTWISCNRAAILKEASVAPGQIGTFEFWMTTPYALDGREYKEYFKPLVEGISWMNDIGQHWKFKMNSPDYKWQYQGQNSHQDSARTQTFNLANAQSNATYYLRLRAKNTGGKTWLRSVTKLGTSNPLDRTSIFSNSSWPIAGKRAAILKEASVAPGQIGTFEFSITTPNDDGIYREDFRPLIEGESWLNDVGLYWSITVQ